jgi:hypothetical protein
VQVQGPGKVDQGRAEGQPERLGLITTGAVSACH